jgi:hypothetical protein
VSRVRCRARIRKDRGKLITPHPFFLSITMPAATSPPRPRRRLVLPITLALVLGVFTTIALCWCAAVIFPPKETDDHRKVDAAILIGDQWFHAAIFVSSGKGSLLSFAHRHYDAQWSHFGPVNPARQDRGSPGARDPGDLASVPPLGAARWLMPWLYEIPSNSNTRERWIDTYGWPLPAMAHLRDFTELAPPAAGRPHDQFTSRGSRLVRPLPRPRCSSLRSPPPPRTLRPLRLRPPCHALGSTLSRMRRGEALVIVGQMQCSGSYHSICDG